MRLRRTTTYDVGVGRRVRDCRVMLGLTQFQLAEMVGVTYQQVHKFEYGKNRISAGQLFEIARALDTPVAYFFEGLDDEPEASALRQRRLVAFMQAVGAIRDRHSRELLSAVVHTLAGH